MVVRDALLFDLKSIQSAAYRVSVDGDRFTFVDANPACLALTGFAQAFTPGLTPQDIFPADVAAILVGRYRACCTGEASSHISSSMVGLASRRWRTTLFPIAGNDGRTASIIGVCSPLEETGAEIAVPKRSGRESITRNSADWNPQELALEALDGGFWTFDLTTREFQTSRGLAEKLAGPGHATLDLAGYASHVHADDLRLEMPDGENDVTVEFRVFTHQKKLRWLQTRRRPVRDASGQSTHVVGIVFDITEQKIARMRLEREAATDALTCVGNRRSFDNAAGRYFADQACRRFGLVIIDLNGLKLVNDRYGHQAGDDLLREAGRRLAQLVEPGSVLSRIGGDEFTMLLPDTSPEKIGALVDRIEAIFVEPFSSPSGPIFVGASCGSAMRRASDLKVGDIVARADQALYAVKNARGRLRA